MRFRFDGAPNECLILDGEEIPSGGEFEATAERAESLASQGIKTTPVDGGATPSRKPRARKPKRAAAEAPPEPIDPPEQED